jgi:hypothetical protein
MYLAWLTVWISWNGSNPQLLIIVCAPILLGISAFGLQSAWSVIDSPRFFLTSLHILCLAVHGSVAIYCWPLRINFANSQSLLDAEMARLARGEDATYPRQVGGFNVLAADKRGSIMLVTVPDRAGNEGLVWTATAENGPGFSPWSETRLSEHWWLVQED